MPVPPRVLVVDDDPLIQEVVALTLRAQDWIVDTAADGQAAIDVLRRGATDLVVTDLDLPVLDGGALLALVALEWPSLPVIVISGDVCEAAGVAAGRWVLAKPFSPRALAALAHHVLAARATPAA
jgi:CheY-like chemotaxis protein